MIDVKEQDVFMGYLYLGVQVAPVNNAEHLERSLVVAVMAEGEFKRLMMRERNK